MPLTLQAEQMLSPLDRLSLAPYKARLLEANVFYNKDQIKADHPGISESDLNDLWKAANRQYNTAHQDLLDAENALIQKGAATESEIRAWRTEWGGNSFERLPLWQDVWTDPSGY